MSVDVTNNSDTFLMLESIKQYADGLSERHLHQQYIHQDHGPILQSLITSAFRNLSECIDIINTQSPISKLTQDALSVIFHETRQADLAEPDLQGTWSPPSIPTPLCLSQVSKSWKRVAENLPTLWTTVKISTPWSLASIKKCLSMSRSLPINLYIKGLQWKRSASTEGRALYYNEGDIASMCTSLSFHVHRCRSISIVTDKKFWPLLQEVGEQFSAVEAPLLETLSIVGTSPYGDGFCGPDNLFKKGTPRLTNARFSLEALASCCPHFETITTLSLGGNNDFEFGSLVDVLSECAALETLIIYGNLVPHWVEAPTGLPLPNLRSIQLYGSAHRTITFLWDLSTPSLTELSILPCKEFAWLWFQEDTGRLPFHTLKTLTISPHPSYYRAPEMMHPAFSDASSCFPQVENLTLIGPGTHQMLQALTLTKGAGAWPGLQSLTLPEIRDENDENALYDFVTLRELSGESLPRIFLDSISLQRITRLDWLRTHTDVVENDVVRDHVGGFPGFEASVAQDFGNINT